MSPDNATPDTPAPEPTNPPVPATDNAPAPAAAPAEQPAAPTTAAEQTAADLIAPGDPGTPVNPPPVEPPKGSEYRLKISETQTLLMVRDHQNAIFSILLSQIADALGYKVTQNTQFALSADLSVMSISELQPADGGEVQTAPTPPAEPADNASPVVSSDGGQVVS